MKKVGTYLTLTFFALFMLPMLGQAAELVGHWTFDSVADSTGNFEDLILEGAELIDGQLDVGVGLWAHAANYTGPDIGEVTLISLLSMDDISVLAGSALTLDRVLSDQFNGIVFGERVDQQWMNGSNNFVRTDDFPDAFTETETGVMIQIAISHEDDGSGTAIVRGYRNGESLGEYTQGPLATWATGDAEVIFGKRHFNNATNATPGDMDAHIEEAWIYSGVLSADEISGIAATEPAGKLTTTWGAIK